MKKPDRRICPLLILFCFLALNACSSKGNNVSSSMQAKAPVANAGGPYTGAAVQPVRFDGTGSSDPQGQVLTYSWNFGDGQTGTGSSPTHAYSARGSYSVALTVTDTSNLASTANTTASISSPPIANAGGPYTGVVGTPISFSGTGSTDPQGEPLTYLWNFGDGTTATGSSPTHAFSSSGSYSITVTVTNSSALSATATTTANVVGAQPPVANAGGPYTGAAGSAVLFDGSKSSDPQNEPLTYSWIFGDGTTGTGVSPSHSYTAPGVYSVSLAVSNAALSGSVTTTATIVPGPQPPIPDAGGPYFGTVGQTLSLDGTGSSDPQGQPLTYAWNFGDGTTSSDISPSHVYTAAGTFVVSLTITATSNLVETAQAQATITPATGAVINGIATTGKHGIAGAHIRLFAANTSGYGQPSVSLLTGALTGTSDSLGGFVTSAADGTFIVPGGYSCSPGSQLYLYATGGDAGSGANPASGLLAAIGTCPAAAASITMNEVSTVASAFAFAGFATDATHVASSGTALATVGISNAFANAANLVALTTGTALSATPVGNGVAPQSKLNSLANVLASCVSNGSSCGSLLATATSDGTSGGTQPTDTATAAINIAHHPAQNIASLYPLGAAVQVYTPATSTQPTDFALHLLFSEVADSDPNGIAIDRAGAVWIANVTGENIDAYGSIAKLSSAGAVLSGATGFVGGDGSGFFQPLGLAIDGAGSVWVTSAGSGIALDPDGGGGITKFSNAGALLSGSGYGTGGLLEPLDIAIDSYGNAWIAGYLGAGIGELSNTGSNLSGANGFASPTAFPTGIAVDSQDDIWVTTSTHDTVLKLSNDGSVVSGSGFIGGGLAGPSRIAIDAAGNAWATNVVSVGDTSGTSPGSITELSSAGTALSPASGYSGGGVDKPVGIAIDGASNVWIANNGDGAIAELSNAGAPLSPSTGFTLDDLTGDLINPLGQIAVDGSGNVWVTVSTRNAVIELIGAATPVVTPVSTGVKMGTLGTRP